MKKLIICLIAALFLWGCPDPQTGKVDPYLTAHTVINQVGMAVPIAQGIFNQWVYAQSDQEKVQKAQLKFNQILTAVSNGLAIAHNGVDIAKQAKEDPDVSKLLAQADEAWKSLYKFLDDLMGTAPPKDTTPAEEGVGTKSLALSAKSPLADLPKSLIP